MKSLVEFISESISKSEILKSAKEVSDLKSILLELGFKKTRVAKWNKAVKDVLGTNKSLYVASTYGTDKSNKEALKAIIDKGQIRRNGAPEITWNKDGSHTTQFFEITSVDITDSNKKFHEIFNKENWSSKDTKELADMFKTHMKADLARNAYIKKVGITDDVKKQIEDMCNAYGKSFARDGVALTGVKSNEGDPTEMIPSLFVVGEKVIRAVVFGWDATYGDERYTKKMNGNYIIVFSKDDIDNLKK